MSTRATYEFQDDNYRGNFTIYIHHDGYPEGAAGYLQAALRLVDGGLPERMLRANRWAELTGSHDSHDDTEYRYTIRGGEDGPGATILAEKVDGNDNWTIFFTGSLGEFIRRLNGDSNDSKTN